MHAVVRVDVQRQHEVRARGVRERRPLGLGRAGSSRRVSSASMPVAAMRPSSRRARSHIRSASVTPADRHAAVRAAVTGVDHDPLPAQAGAGLAQQLLLAQQVRAAALDPTGAELAQRAQRRRPADAVRDVAVVALERAQPALGLLVEHPAGPAGVVAELQQLLLQRHDVVPAHRRRDQQREHAVTERPAGLAQRAIGRLTDDAVGDQPALLLEGAHGVLDDRVEVVRRPVASRSLSSPNCLSILRISTTAGPVSPRRSGCMHSSLGSARYDRPGPGRRRTDLIVPCHHSTGRQWARGRVSRVIATLSGAWTYCCRAPADRRSRP